MDPHPRLPTLKRLRSDYSAWVFGHPTHPDGASGEQELSPTEDRRAPASAPDALTARLDSEVAVASAASRLVAGYHDLLHTCPTPPTR